MSESMLKALSGRDSGAKSESTSCTIPGGVNGYPLYEGRQSLVARGEVGLEGMASTSKGFSSTFPLLDLNGSQHKTVEPSLTNA